MSHNHLQCHFNLLFVTTTTLYYHCRYSCPDQMHTKQKHWGQVSMHLVQKHPRIWEINSMLITAAPLNIISNNSLFLDILKCHFCSLNWLTLMSECKILFACFDSQFSHVHLILWTICRGNSRCQLKFELIN